ncbi:hypothetical protein [Photobacterium satsumensis]|uniref:hypothetical protein n=1 Tax=Photobacterium satsumensis TaxID=2910239 RepID=UPI003D0B4182
MKKIALMAVASMFLYGCVNSNVDEPSSVIPVDLKKSDLLQVLSEKATTDVLDIQYLLSEAEMNNEDMVEFKEQLILALGQEQINNSFISQAEIENLSAIAKEKPDNCYVKENYEYYSPQLQEDVIFVVEHMRLCWKGDYVALDTSIGDYQIDVKYGDTVMTTTRDASYYHSSIKVGAHSYASRSVGKLTLTEDALSFETPAGMTYDVDKKGVVTRSDIGLIGVIH